MSQKENIILKNDPFENKMDLSGEITHDDINTRNFQTEDSEKRKQIEEKTTIRTYLKSLPNFVKSFIFEFPILMVCCRYNL